MASFPQLDVLALAAHPDDVELSCGGTICKLAQQGYKVGVVDFTRGELGTRGTPEKRAEEANRASEIMGLTLRENLGMPDGNIENTLENRQKLIRVLRGCRPHMVLMNPLECRHPDHGNAARLSIDACYYAGLKKIETAGKEGNLQEPWRPDHMLHYIQAIEFKPTLIVDVSDVWKQRVQAMQAFKSQFFNPEYEGEEEPETFISNPEFLEWIEARAHNLGHQIGASYGEGFRYHRGPFGVSDLMQVFSNKKQFK